MEVLCFDIGSGGITAARFDEQLNVSALREISWDLHRDAQGRATISAEHIESAILELSGHLRGDAAPAAVSFACFMHSFLVLSSCCAPLTPVFTWLDTTAPDAIQIIRRRLGDGFHKRTGCHYHPMFPVFKLAANPPGRGNRVGSPKAWLIWELAGSFVEDFGMAAASGLLDVREGKWDPELLGIANLELPDVPEIVSPYAAVGAVSEAAVARFGLPRGTTVVSGSGDGFMANVGSACTTPRRMAVTLGTSGGARQMVPKPALNPFAGTFCYRASRDAFLLGCATSNGGNVLDWARRSFGRVEPVAEGRAIPVFLPWMNGERSLEWNPDLQPSWHDRTAENTPQDLSRAVAEGVLFNLAQYVEVIERESGVVADQVVLSGNGFRNPALPPLLASLLGRELFQPADAGLETLRGAAVYAWRALGQDAGPALERMLESASVVKPSPDDSFLRRFEKFKNLRSRAAGEAGRGA